MALIFEAISHKLAQKEVIVYLLDYLGHLVNSWASALASVVEQDWWLVFAFHHICLCKSSFLYAKIVTWNLYLDFSGLVETPQSDKPWQGCVILLSGSRWTLSWCLGLFGGAGLGYVPILIPNTPRQGLFFWGMFMTALGISSPVQDYLTGSVSWGCSRVLNLYLVRYSFLHPQVWVPHVLLVLGPWTT